MFHVKQNVVSSNDTLSLRARPLKNEPHTNTESADSHLLLKGDMLRRQIIPTVLQLTKHTDRNQRIASHTRDTERDSM